MYANIIYTPYLRHDLNYDAYYLQHHGIKGQKWGIRRFQNEDGTLTNAGRKRKGFKERVKGVGQKIKNAPVGTKAGVAGGLLAAKSIKDSLANARAAEELMGVALAKDQVITKTILHAGKVGAIAALAVIGGHMVHDYVKSNPDKIKKAKTYLFGEEKSNSLKDKYIGAFDKKASNWQDRADRKRLEGEQSKKIFEKAAQRREDHAKRTLEDKERAKKLTSKISDNNKFKKGYLDAFDKKASNWQDRADRKRLEGEQSKKIFEKAAQRREDHVKRTLEDKERARKMLKK